MIYSKVVIKNCRQTPILIFSPWQQPKIIRYVFSFVKRNISRYAKLSIRKLFYTQGLQAYIKRRHLLIHIHTCKTHWQCADDASIVSSDVVASPSYIGWKEAEWDILRKMSISNNSKIFFKACLVSGIRSSPPSSYIGNNIATVVVNIVTYFLEVSETALKTVSFLHHASLFNRFWSGNSCPSFVRVKNYYYNVGFIEMYIHCDLCHSNIIILRDFGMDYFYY